MSAFAFALRDITKTISIPAAAMAGGKGAYWEELCRIDGIKVPGGFCINTLAYKKLTEGNL